MLHFTNNFSYAIIGLKCTLNKINKTKSCIKNLNNGLESSCLDGGSYANPCSLKLITKHWFKSSNNAVTQLFTKYLEVLYISVSANIFKCFTEKNILKLLKVVIIRKNNRET